MVTIQTQSGIGLETLPVRDRRMEAAAVAVCAAVLAAAVAGALIAAGLRGCAADPAPAAADYEAAGAGAGRGESAGVQDRGGVRASVGRD
jgi:hypothetical protein